MMTLRVRAGAATLAGPHVDQGRRTVPSEYVDHLRIADSSAIYMTSLTREPGDETPGFDPVRDTVGVGGAARRRRSIPGPGDVLVRMEAAAVNPSDLLLLRGVYLARPEPPAPVGGEGVGIVVDAGAQADQCLLGKRVIVLPTYTYGTWAEKVVVPQDETVEVAPDADPLQLAMLSINPATAHMMLNRFSTSSPATGSHSRARTRPSDAL